ncbi:HipA domain-containing protein [Idiomarina sp. HP20-50]|uniref:HipA domain-containing protein n=1 Tax=Idiomarina sp. HP20-50 TaxID=3070813 RepID=UPI00294B6D79|nr:HipA domain-containing protein [Idiomarina sp. HP20-50]MDV6316094.1 HipA domain-containing protein [Idiomarina sp. HP20-50]
MSSSLVEERQLSVYINDKPVGQLKEHNGLWVFEYTQNWLEGSISFALTPSLNLTKKEHIDTGTQRPVQWFFDNLLPEEKAREVLAKDYDLDKEDAFALLEAIGAESAGAITLLNPGETLPPGGLFALTDSDISRRIHTLPKGQMNSKQRKRMSLAGAQHKMLLVINEEGRFEPSGQTPSTHILKPEHTQPEFYWFTVRNEYFVMTLAQRCQLIVPKVDIDYVPEPIYIVERFDRAGTYPNTQRVHVLDGCQMLDISASAKYRASNVAALKRLVDITRAPAQTAFRLFRWALFNFLVGNGDAHLKNLTFRYSVNDCQLMPHYDLLSTAVYTDARDHVNEELSQPIGGAKYFGQVSRKSVLAFAEDLGLNKPVAEREIERLCKSIQQEADKLITELEQQPNFESRAGELQLLRNIRYRCIGEFVSQLM